jgi:hypothetical protein
VLVKWKERSPPCLAHRSVMPEAKPVRTSNRTVMLLDCHLPALRDHPVASIMGPRRVHFDRRNDDLGGAPALSSDLATSASATGWFRGPRWVVAEDRLLVLAV